MHKLRHRRFFAAFAIAVALPSLAHAQAWPTHPITLMVPFAAGGAVDIPARQVANELSPILGQQIIVENRSGANGNIGAAAVAKAEPDGHTLLFAPPGVLANNRFMFKSMPFDPDKAFAPIILFGKSPLVIAANKNVPVHDLPGLIAYAKANPGKLNIGTPGAGSQAHLTMELLQRASGTQMSYVPYRGGANVNADLVGGQIDLTVTFLPSIISFLRDGSLRGLAVTTLERSKQVPDIATVSEFRFPRLRIGRVVQHRRASRDAGADHSTAQHVAQRLPGTAISRAAISRCSTCSRSVVRRRCSRITSPAKSPNGAP